MGVALRIFNRRGLEFLKAGAISFGVAGSTIAAIEILGIPVTISPLILVTIALISLAARRYVLKEVDWYPAGVYWICGFVGAVFVVVSIIGHEMSHAWVSQQIFDVPITQMRFTWWGGFVKPEKIPSEVSATYEFWMVLAGPLFNLLTAAILVIPVLRYGESAAENTLQYICSTNASLGVINLIPIHPFDGGKILHAILWWFYKEPSIATRIVSTLTVVVIIIVVIVTVVSAIMRLVVDEDW